MSMNLHISTLLSAAAIVLATQGVVSAQSAGSGAAAAGKAATEYRFTRWEELVPKDWEPLKRFNDMNLANMADGSSRAQEMLRELREAWDNAPTNSSLDGSTVKLPGYIVPLEEVKGELKEFLLVPYFGACIHTPPPPANQIVHVVTGSPLLGFRMMEPVWVSGILSVQRQDSAMGVSGYKLRSVAVDRYTGPPKP